MAREITKEFSNCVDVYADSIVTVGTNIHGDETINFVFFKNYPVIDCDEFHALNVTVIEKRRVASVTVTQSQAQRFYESLKSIFEPQA